MSRSLPYSAFWAHTVAAIFTAIMATLFSCSEDAPVASGPRWSETLPGYIEILPEDSDAWRITRNSVFPRGASYDLGRIAILPEATLYIEPGVTITTRRIECEGTLRVAGTALQPVVLSRKRDYPRYNSAFAIEGDRASAELRHCVLDSMSSFRAVGASLILDSCIVLKAGILQATDSRVEILGTTMQFPYDQYHGFFEAKNCKVEISDSKLYAEYNNEFEIRGASHGRLQRSSFQNIRVGINGPAQFDVVECDFEGRGLGMNGADGARITRCRFKGYGFWVTSSRNVLIEKCEVDSSRFGIGVNYSSAIIRNCQVKYITDRYLDVQGGNVLVQNTLFDHGEKTEFYGDLPRIQFYGENGASKLNLINCIVWGSIGMKDYRQLGSWTFRNSILYGATEGRDHLVDDVAFLYCNLDTIRYEEAQARGTLGVGCQLLDPLFVPTNEDYLLTVSSPCINAGDWAVEFRDADGTRNDIGLYGGPWGMK